jgi:hypothetical protein
VARFTPPLVIVMQRVHQADLAGHVLEQGGFEHLCLPAEAGSSKSAIFRLNSARHAR